MWTQMEFPDMPHRNPIQNGFTLVEMLVVITIAGLLLTILLPSLSAARELSRKTVCSSQMRQMHMGVQLYMSDYNQWLPNRFNTYSMQPNYLRERTIDATSHHSNIKAVFLNYLGNSYVGNCPSNPYLSGSSTGVKVLQDPRQDTLYWEDASTGSYIYYGGGMDLTYGQVNWGMQPGFPGRGRIRGETSVKQPTQYAYFWERMSLWTPGYSPYYENRKGNDWSNHAASGAPEGSNVATMDGAVKWMPLMTNLAGVSGNPNLDSNWWCNGAYGFQMIFWRGNPDILINSGNTIYNNVTSIIDLRSCAENY